MHEVDIQAAPMEDYRTSSDGKDSGECGSFSAWKTMLYYAVLGQVGSGPV